MNIHFNKRFVKTGLTALLLSLVTLMSAWSANAAEAAAAPEVSATQGTQYDAVELQWTPLAEAIEYVIERDGSEYAVVPSQQLWYQDLVGTSEVHVYRIGAVMKTSTVWSESVAGYQPQQDGAYTIGTTWKNVATGSFTGKKTIVLSLPSKTANAAFKIGLSIPLAQCDIAVKNAAGDEILFSDTVMSGTLSDTTAIFIDGAPSPLWFDDPAPAYSPISDYVSSLFPTSSLTLEITAPEGKTVTLLECSAQYFTEIRGQPPIFNETGGGADALKLVWGTMNAGDKYSQLYRAASLFSAAALPVTPWSTALDYTDDNAPRGIDQFYWVKSASDISGTDSTVFSVPVSGWRQLEKPVILTVGYISADQAVKLTWTRPQNAGAFQVWRGLEGSTDSKPVSEWLTDTQFADQSFNSGETYWYTIVAGVSPEYRMRAGDASASVKTDLLPPENVVATVNQQGKVTISWNVAAGRFYQVYRSLAQDPHTAAPIRNDWISEGTQTDLTVTPLTTYYYWVKSSFDTSGISISDFSKMTSGYAYAATTEGFLLDSAMGPDGINLTWNTFGSVGYEIYRVDTAGTVSMKIGDTAGLVYTDTNVKFGHLYYYYVSAPTVPAVSNLVQIICGHKAPVVIGRAMVDKNEIAWTESSQEITSFMVYRNTTGVFNANNSITGWISDHFYDDVNINPGTQYYYWVRGAENTSGRNMSEPSHPISLTPKTAVPANVIASSAYLDTIRLTWTAVHGQTPYYKVFRNTVNDSVTASALTAWQLDTVYIDTSSLVLGQIYYYWVQAAQSVSGTSPGAYSTAAAGKIAIGKISNLVAVSATSGVTLSWDAPAQAPFAKVFRDQQILSTGEFETFEDLNGNPGEEYVYSVVCGNNAAFTVSSDTVYINSYKKLTSPVVTAHSAAGGPQLTWIASEGAGLYKVNRSSPNAKTFSVTNTQFTDIEVASQIGVMQSYTVTAYVAEPSEKPSEPSAAVNAMALLAPPQNVSASQNNVNGIAVAWDSVQYAQTYALYRGGSIADSAIIAQNIPGSVTATIDTGAVPEQPYSYWVEAAANGIVSVSGEVSGFRPIGITTGFTASQGTYVNQIRLDWDPTPGCSVYQLERSSSGDSTKIIAQWVPDTAYIDNTAVTGIIYTYRLTAAYNTSGTPAALPVETDGYTELNPPLDISASQNEDGKITVSWTAGGQGVYYKVFRNTVPDTASATEISGWISADKYDDAAVPPFTVYYYWVRSALSPTPSTLSAYSAAAEGRALPAPNPTFGLVAVSGQPEGVPLAWTGSDQPFTIYRATEKNVLGNVIVSGVTLQHYTDKEVSPGTTWWYRVKSANGTFSDAVSAVRGYPTPVLTGSSELYQNQLNWTADPALAYFKVYRSEGPDWNPADSVTTWIMDKTYTDSTAIVGTYYTYRVAGAKTAGGGSETQLSDSVVLAALLGQPETIVASETYVDSIGVMWDTVPQAVCYQVYRSLADDLDDADTVTGWITDTAYADVTDLVPGANYYYWVRAAVSDTGAFAGAYTGPAVGCIIPATPNQPVGLVATQGTLFKKVEISWMPPDNNGTYYYRVYRSIGDLARPAISGWQKDTSWTDGDVQNGIQYFYWVAASRYPDGHSPSEMTGPVEGYSKVLPEPDAPVITSCSQGNYYTQIEIKWLAPLNDNNAYYIVERVNLLTEKWETLNTWTQTLSFIDKGLEPGEVYFYRVRAAADKKGNQKSEWSNIGFGYTGTELPEKTPVWVGGEVLGLAADSIAYDAGSGPALTEYMKKPSIYGYYQDYTTGKMKKVQYQILTKFVKGQPQKTVNVLNTKGTRLYSTKGLKEYRKSGKTVAQFLAVPGNQADSLRIPLYCKTIIENIKIDNRMFVDFYVVPPMVDTVSLPVGGADSVPLLKPETEFKIIGYAFGQKAPKVYIEYKSGSHVKKVNLKVLKPYPFTDAKGKLNASCTDPISGNSEITVLSPKKWPSNIVDQSLYIVIESQDGLTVTPVKPVL